MEYSANSSRKALNMDVANWSSMMHNSVTSTPCRSRMSYLTRRGRLLVVAYIRLPSVKAANDLFMGIQCIGVTNASPMLNCWVVRGGALVKPPHNLKISIW